MSVSQESLSANTVERERLRKLIDRLSEDDLKKSVGEGWTVATLLVHLAFWDQRALTGLAKWERDGIGLARFDDNAVHAVNEAVRAISFSIPPAEAAKLALDSAELVDRKVSRLSDEFVETIRRAGLEGILQRATHRRHHLDCIERALG